MRGSLNPMVAWSSLGSSLEMSSECSLETSFPLARRSAACLPQIPERRTFEKRSARGGLGCRHPQRAPSHDSRGTGYRALSRCPSGGGGRARVKQRLSRRSVWHRLLSRFLHVIIRVWKIHWGGHCSSTLLWFAVIAMMRIMRERVRHTFVTRLASREFVTASSTRPVVRGRDTV